MHHRKPPTRKWRIGDMINNQYEIEKILGSGGMGIVYRVWDHRLKQRRALKALYSQGETNHSPGTYQELRKRFQREYDIMHDLQHKHIVYAFEKGIYRGTEYFVMEYCSQGSLHEKIYAKARDNRPLSAKETCGYIKQAASALDYIHNHGCIHRDIKPKNMLIDAQGTLKLVDFGIAHIPHSVLTALGQPGTVDYQSPEARQHKAADWRDDIYSLGIVLDEMLAGEEPNKRPQVGSGVPRKFIPIIQTATAEHRQDRYQSTREMARALEEALIQPDHLSPNYNNGTIRPRIYGENIRQRRPPVHGPRRLDPLARNYLGHAPDNVPRRKLVRSQRRPEPQQSWLSQLLSIGTIVIAAAMVFFFIASGVFSKNSTNQPQVVFPHVTTEASSGLSPQIQAQALVQQYYANWNNKDYQAAYNLLQDSYQQQHPFASLLFDYQHTHHACIVITKTTLLATGTVQVEVTDNAIEDASSGGATIILYHLIYNVAYIKNTWKLAPIVLKLESLNGICHF